MGKKDTKFSLGLNRQELKELSIKLGKTQQQVDKASTKTLQNYINKNYKNDSSKVIYHSKSYPSLNILKEPKKGINQSQEKRTRKGKDTDFQYGIGRTELKRLAIDLGYKGNAGKANTKALEKFIKNKMIGREKEIVLTQPMKNDIKGFFDVSYAQGKAYMSEKLHRVAGVKYEGDDALKNEIGKQFSVYYEGVITKDIVDELLYRRLQYTNNSDVWNGLKNTFVYMDTFKEYAKELNEKEL